MAPVAEMIYYIKTCLIEDKQKITSQNKLERTYENFTILRSDALNVSGGHC